MKGIDTFNNLLLHFTEILEDSIWRILQIPLFAYLGSGHDIRVEEVAQEGQKNMHSSASLNEAMSKSFSFTQAYWSLHRSILTEGKKLSTREGLALHCTALVYARMEINLAILLVTADLLIDASSLSLCFLRLQLFPIGRKSTSGVCWANSLFLKKCGLCGNCGFIFFSFIFFFT